MKPGNIREMTLTAMFTALTLAATMFVNIRLPIAANGGLVHLGNVPLFVAAAVLGRRPAALSGAVGMALFDLISGWAVWAPGTFIIVGCMGLAAGAIMGRLRGAGGYVLAAAAALAIKIVGYYIFEWMLYGNFLAPLASIPGNVVQVSMGVLVAAPIVAALRRFIPRSRAARA